MSGCIKHIDGIRISQQGLEEQKCPKMLPVRAACDMDEPQQECDRKNSFHQRRAVCYKKGKKLVLLKLVLYAMESPRTTG